jgi:hypothetical protein
MSSTGFGTEYTKTTSKSFDVKPGVLLDIRTEFAEVKAHNWDKQKISIEATVTVDASSQSKANDRFERIKLEIDGSKDLVSIISSIESNFFSKNNNNISIDFLIYYPANSQLKLNMEFGSAFFENIEGPSDIDIEYGSFNANNLSNTNNQIEISFGKFQVSKLGGGDIEIDYGGCEIEDVNTLNLHTSFSGNVNLEKVGDLMLKSAYDKVSIGEAKNIRGSLEFSAFKLDYLEKNLEIKAAYGSFKVYSIAKDFELIDLNSEFCSLKLYVDKDSNFSFNTDVELGSFNYPKEKITITDFQKEVTELSVEGYFGSKEKAKGIMRLSVDNASANINIK